MEGETKPTFTLYAITKTGYKFWHNRVGRVINKKLCKRQKLDLIIIIGTIQKLSENVMHRIPWDFEIQMDHQTQKKDQRSSPLKQLKELKQRKAKN